MKTILLLYLIGASAIGQLTTNEIWFTNTVQSVYWLHSINGTSNSFICFSNNARPAVFQPAYGDPITNIVLDTQFQGTIQIGQDFYRIQSETNVSYKLIK